MRQRPVFPWLAALAAVVVALSAALPASATQYSPPYADIFGNNWDNLNSTDSARRFAGFMDSAGYHDFTDLNLIARTSMGSAFAQSDAIWASFGHSHIGGGGILFCDQDGSPCNHNTSSWLWANTALGGACSSPDQCLSLVSGLNDIRFMLFAGCYSGLDGFPGSYQQGNLFKVAQASGVDNVYGFSGEVYWPMGDDFASFLGTELANGSTIQYAMWKAGQEVKNRWFDNAWGWNTYVGVGYTNDKIVPAAYGRQ